MPTNPRAFSTLELMIALMIMTTTISAVIFITLGLPAVIQDGSTEDIATNKTAALLNQAFSQGLTSFVSVVSIATSTKDGVTSSLNVTLLPDGVTKRLLSTVSWLDSHGYSRYVTASGILTDFRNAAPSSCSNVLTGDWEHPSVAVFPLSYPISVANADSAISSSLLAAGVTNKFSQSDPGILIFDISSSTSPVLKSSINTASTTKSGPAAIAIHNGTIYAANSFPANFSTCVHGPSCSQLQVITGSLNSPVLASSFQLATTTAPYAAGSGGQASGRSIFYANNYIYLGLQKVATSSTGPAGDEFNILDVNRPSSLKWVGGYSIGRTINQIQVQNGYAYLTTDDSTKELVILDVHDPANITLAGSYDAPGPANFGYGEALSVSSTTIGLGRSYNIGESNLAFLTAATSGPVLLGGDQATDPLSSLSIQGILLRGFLSFILSSSTLQIWNISNPSKPYFDQSLLLPNGIVSNTHALACRHNTLYVAANNGSNLGYLYAISSQ